MAVSLLWWKDVYKVSVDHTASDENGCVIRNYSMIVGTMTESAANTATVIVIAVLVPAIIIIVIIAAVAIVVIILCRKKNLMRKGTFLYYG